MLSCEAPIMDHSKVYMLYVSLFIHCFKKDCNMHSATEEPMFPLTMHGGAADMGNQVDINTCTHAKGVQLEVNW